LFLRSDPTLQGSLTLLNARPLLSVAAHAGLMLIGMHQVLAPQTVSVAARHSARLCYGVLALELLSLLPCLVGRDALCGVYYVFLGPIAAMTLFVGFAVYLATSRSRVLIATTVLVLFLSVGSALAAYWYITPKSPEQCDRIVEPIGRDTCRMNFALQANDAALCETVDFDSSRWSCTYQIAEQKGDPALCDRIALPCRNRSPGTTCDPELYRNTCFLVVARKLHDPRLCERMTPGDLRERCLEQAR
jgi:hypothetical protein